MASFENRKMHLKKSKEEGDIATDMEKLKLEEGTKKHVDN
jgi:hypothetical protein